MVKNPPVNEGDVRATGSVPGSGRSPGEEHNNPQYSCLENPLDSGAWWATVHGVAKSQTRLSDFTTPLSVASLAVIFSHSEVCLFTLLLVSLVAQKPLNLIRSHLFIFAFVSITLGDGSKRILL